MGRIYCPQCGASRVISGKSPVLVILGIIVLVCGALALAASFTGPLAEDWAGFVPLEQEDSCALIVIVFGLLLLWGGTRHWRDLMCVQCGHTWQPAPHQIAWANHRQTKRPR